MNSWAEALGSMEDWEKWVLAKALFFEGINEGKWEVGNGKGQGEGVCIYMSVGT